MTFHPISGNRPAGAVLESLAASHYRIPLPEPCSDSTHGEMREFELVTVRVRASDGAEGLGYTYTVGRGGGAIHALIAHDLAPLVRGLPADEVEAAWERMWRAVHFVGRGGLASFAMAAVDIALWDLRARRRNEPLWRTLGGQGRPVPVYAGGIDLHDPIEKLRQRTEERLARGLRAIKMKVGRENIAEDAARVKAIRETIGPDVTLMVDANMAWAPAKAIEAARAFREFDIEWLEEPTEPDDWEAHRRIAGEGGVAVAAGENLHTEPEFRYLLEIGQVAFPQPDAATLGGITPWVRVARRAQEKGLPVTSHGIHDVHVHLLSAAGNGGYLEWHGFGLDRFLTRTLDVRGALAWPPTEPGLGFDLDRQKLERHASGEAQAGP